MRIEYNKPSRSCSGHLREDCYYGEVEMRLFEIVGDVV